MTFPTLACNSWGNIKRGHELVIRVQDSVLITIWPQVLLIFIYSVCLLFINDYVAEIPKTDTILMSIFGFVIGALIAFRTHTAYERYVDGRKQWATMYLHIRTIVRCFWLAPSTTAYDIVAKRSAINLLVAFAFATKNYLRKDYTTNADPVLSQLISHLPDVWNPKAKNETLPAIVTEIQTAPPPVSVMTSSSQIEVNITIPEHLNNRSEESTTAATTSKAMDVPLTPRFMKWFRSRRISRQKKWTLRLNSYKPHDVVATRNIPLEIIYYIHTYISKIAAGDSFKDTGTVVYSLTELLTALQNMERIRRSPIPLAYSIHLHQAIWLYLIILPLQLAGKLGWVTIPAVLLVAFGYLGILCIGSDIENPFGDDASDLPLDEYCEVIKQEVEKIVARPFPNVDDWIRSPFNLPFHPTCKEPANDLVDLDIDDLLSVAGGGTKKEKLTREPDPENVAQKDIELQKEDSIPPECHFM